MTENEMINAINEEANKTEEREITKCEESFRENVTSLLGTAQTLVDIAPNAIVKVETTGNITRNYMEIPVETKDENGNKIIVQRKLRNELAIASMATIDIIGELRKKSLKMLVLAMAKITDEHAQSVDKKLKTAKALIKQKYPEYSDNTINKYRRIGLLFSNDITSATDYTYISFIDEDVNISNLDAILTLIDIEDVEKASIEERQKAVAMFYDKYIATDLIHLSASQTVVKREVHEILNPAIDVESTVIDETETKAESETETETKAESETETETKAESETETKAESETETDTKAYMAQLCIEKLKVIFTDNKKAQKALATLMEEIEKLF